jgi:hypothetical protein
LQDATRKRRAKWLKTAYKWSVCLKIVMLFIKIKFSATSICKCRTVYIDSNNLSIIIFFLSWNVFVRFPITFFLVVSPFQETNRVYVKSYIDILENSFLKITKVIPWKHVLLSKNFDRWCLLEVIVTRNLKDTLSLTNKYFFCYGKGKPWIRDVQTFLFLFV